MKTAENNSAPQLSQRIAVKQGLRQRYLLIGLSVLLTCTACLLYYLLQQPDAKANPVKQRNPAPLAVQVEAVDIHPEVRVEDNVPVLRWKGEFPQGSSFLLERSTDGNDWELMQRVPKEEVMTGANNYRFSDAEADGMNMHYRVTCVDAQDKVLGSREVEVSLAARKEQLITITGIEPLPFASQFSVNFEAEVAEPISFEIFDNNNVSVYSEVYTVKKGENLIGFTRGDKLMPGVYIIRLSGSDNAVAMTKVIKNQ